MLSTCEQSDVKYFVSIVLRVKACGTVDIDSFHIEGEVTSAEFEVDETTLLTTTTYETRETLVDTPVVTISGDQC